MTDTDDLHIEVDPHNLLDVKDLTSEYEVRLRGVRGHRKVSAVSNVSFQLSAGQTLGIVGETGCGKSTLARSLLQAVRPNSGQVLYRGRDLVKLQGKALHEQLRNIQMVFQDPFGSLDPRWRIAEILREPLSNRRRGRDELIERRISELLELVGLNPDRYLKRRPRELSGGECQRVAIARALALSPELIICDEAVSSLDVSIQAQILNLFIRLRSEFNLAYLFIAHDLTVVKYISDRIAVMHLGKFCEIGSPDQIYRSPRHPYTDALISAIPNTDPLEKHQVVRVVGEPPSPVNPPSGCRYRTRCPRAQERCALEDPPLSTDESGHMFACHFPLEIARFAPSTKSGDTSEGIIRGSDHN